MKSPWSCPAFPQEVKHIRVAAVSLMLQSKLSGLIYFLYLLGLPGLLRESAGLQIGALDLSLGRQ